jgi:asparagine synthase (glutamine-hydrolysing)
LPRARSVAERFGTDHHEIHVTGADLSDLLRRLAVAHDVPFSDAANIPLYQLCEALQGETKVVLQGDGGDELFGGYRRYELLDQVAILGPLARLVQPLLGLQSSSRFMPSRRMAAALAEREPAKRMALLLTTEMEDRSPIRVLAPWLRAIAQGQDAFARYRECARLFDGMDPVQSMLLTDLMIILPDVFLEKVDRATMARSVEVRVPFLDNELVDYAVSLPARTRVRFGHKKRLLREALRTIVPDEILDAPKAGFGVPFGRWMRGEVGELLRSLALDPSSAASELFDRPLLQRLLAEHRRGTQDHGFLLWKCLQLALWNQYVLAPARSVP